MDEKEYTNRETDFSTEEMIEIIAEHLRKRNSARVIVVMSNKEVDDGAVLFLNGSDSIAHLAIRQIVEMMYDPNRLKDTPPKH